MSLFNILNNDPAGGQSLASTQVALAVQQAQARASASASGGTKAGATAPAGNGVSLTLESRRLAAAREDAGKTAAALTSDLRKALDGEYAKAGRKNSADLTALSGRALATIALNRSGRFNRAEIAAAKMELRARDRLALVQQFSSQTLTAGSLARYQQAMNAARATMSAEELSLRESNPGLR